MLVRIADDGNTVYKVCNKCLEHIITMKVLYDYFDKSGNIDFVFNSEAISISPHIHVCKKCLDMDLINKEKGWDKIKAMIFHSMSH